MKLVIIGSSGHGGDVADIAIDNGYTDIVFLTHDLGLDSFCGFPVMTDTAETVTKLHDDGYHFALGVGEPKVREVIYNKYPSLTYPTLIHSSATIGNFQNGDVNTCKGTILSAGSRVTNNVSIADFCFLGVNAVIGHDCIVEDFVSLMPAAVISGNVHIKKGAYIGCNASIRQGLREGKLTIGASSIVGMGAVVLKSVAENHTALGVPAISSCNPIN